MKEQALQVVEAEATDRAKRNRLREYLQHVVLRELFEQKLLGKLVFHGGTEQIDPVYNGAFGVDVRNADGLILMSDMSSGFWTFRMDGFQGWNGEDWGMPDISSAQKWDAPSRKPIS